MKVGKGPPPGEMFSRELRAVLNFELLLHPPIDRVQLQMCGLFRVIRCTLFRSSMFGIIAVSQRVKSVNKQETIVFLIYSHLSVRNFPHSPPVWFRFGARTSTSALFP